MVFLRRLAHVVSVIVAFLFVGVVAQALDTPRPNEQRQPGIKNVGQQPDRAQSNTQTLTLSTPVRPTAETGKSSAQQHEEDIYVQRQIAIASGKTATFTFLLVGIGAAVGLLQIGLLGWQSSSTARAAKAALDTAEATLLAQRAFLIPGEIGLSEPLMLGKAPRFVWQLRNSGPTPAIGLGSFIGFNANGNPLPEKPHYGDETATRPEVVIGPQAPYHLPIVMPFVLTEERLALWMGDVVLYFWVKTPYRDKTGEHRVLRTAIGYVPSTGRNVIPDNPAYFEYT